MGKQYYLEFWENIDTENGFIMNAVEVKDQDVVSYSNGVLCRTEYYDEVTREALPLGDKTLDSIVVQSDIPDETVETMIAKIEIEDFLDEPTDPPLTNVRAVLRNGLHVSQGAFYSSYDPAARQEAIDSCTNMVKSSVRDLIYFLILTARNGLSVPKE